MQRLVLRMKKNKIYYAAFIAIIQMVGILLLFEPTEKSDDFDMCLFLYGGFDGIYDYHVLFVHSILGRFLVGLLKIAPRMPWYAIYMMVIIFVSFLCVHYLYLSERDDSSKYLDVIYMLINFFMAYEIYIRFTFTKVAGISGIAAALLWIYIVYKKKYRRMLLVALFLSINTLLIRGNVVLLIAMLFFSVYVLYAWEHKEKIFTRSFVNLSISVFCGLVLIFGAYKLFYLIEHNEYDRSPEWSSYVQNNDARAALYDYGVPDYKQYAEEYQKIGVSENDYKMWFQDYNYCDREILTVDLMAQIKEILPTEENTVLDRLVWGIRYLPTYFLSSVISVLFLITLVAFLSFAGKRQRWKLWIILGFMLSAYMILVVKGRLQHHVDVIIFLSGIVLLFYNFKPDSVSTKKNRQIILLVTLLCIVIIADTFYGSLTNSSYYQEVRGNVSSYREVIKDNRDKLQVLAEDKDNLYLLGGLETSEIYAAFTVTSEVIEKGFYENIFKMCIYAWPSYDNMLNKFFGEGEALFENIVDNEHVYYCVSKTAPDCSDTIAQYLSEHYQANTKAQFVKYVDDMRVYRFVSAQ